MFVFETKDMISVLAEPGKVVRYSHYLLSWATCFLLFQHLIYLLLESTRNTKKSDLLEPVNVVRNSHLLLSGATVLVFAIHVANGLSGLAVGRDGLAGEDLARDFADADPGAGGGATSLLGAQALGWLCNGTNQVMPQFSAHSKIGWSLYVCGGWNGTKVNSTDTIFTDPENGTESSGAYTLANCTIYDIFGAREGPALKEKRLMHTMTNVTNFLVVTGGYDHDQGLFLSTIEVLNSTAAGWVLQEEKVQLAPARAAHCAASLGGDELLIVGGVSRNESGAINPLDLVQKFNIKTGEVTTLSQLSQARFGHACSFYQGGVVVVGGATSLTEPDSRLPLVEYLDLGTNTWKTWAPLHIPRYFHSMAIVHNKPVVYGGLTVESELSKEVYENGSWTESGVPWLTQLRAVANC